MKTITILIFSIILNGCGVPKEAASNLNQDMAKQTTLNGNFIVSKLEATNIEKELTLNFDDSTKRVSGFSGCNNFFGSYQVNGNKISFANLATTRKMCRGEANTIEQNFIKTLETINSFQLKDNKITLLKDTKELLNANQVINSKKVQIQDNTLNFEYSEITRGSYKNVKVDQNTIKNVYDRNQKAIITPCSKDNWDTLKKLVSAIDIKSLNQLEAPSKAHQFDGAAIATLIITVNGETYKTKSFDDGNPPKEIAELVNTILSFTAEKTKTKN